MRRHSHSGFTLIELSIVLVIIGLLVGGVLVGRDLIEAAKMRRQMTALEELDAAANTFKLKYGGIPGDLLYSKCAAYGLPCDGNVPATYGFHNGDGRISDYDGSCGCHPGLHNGICVSCSIAYFGEPNYFFLHLNAASLAAYSLSNDVNNLPNSAPRLTIGNGYFLPSSSTFGKNGYFLGMGTTSTATHFLHVNAVDGALAPLQAKLLDEKFDNGSPEGGRIRASRLHDTWGVYEDWGPEGWYVHNCVTGSAGSRSYNLATTSFDCQLWVQGSW